jgi:hypothetical protein
MADIHVARARMQRDAVRAALYIVWPRPLGPQLLTEALPADLAPTRAEVDAAIYHLRDRGLIEEQPGGTAPLWRLTRAGIDAHEAQEDGSIDHIRGVRMLRLRCLDGLDAARPQPIGPRLIGHYLNADGDLDRSESAIARALQYLTEAGLAETEPGGWRIPAAGMDYLSGDGPAVLGVAQAVVSG